MLGVVLSTLYRIQSSKQPSEILFWLTPLYPGGKGSSERLSDLSKTTQQVTVLSGSF